jgi:predicted deacetylase
LTGSGKTASVTSLEKMLLVSIHDVGPRFAGEIDRLVDLVGARTGTGRFAMLVVPDHWGEAPIARDPAFRRRLREWAGAGVEMFVHGWSHRDPAPRGFAARHMTDGEGEFSALPRAEALRRMSEGRAVVEEATGRPAAGFIAPAWLYGKGAHDALAEAGFALAEDHLRVWHPPSGRILARGPVITWATRTPLRKASSLIAAAVLRRLLTPLAAVRLAVHPADTRDRATVASIEKSLRILLARRRPAHYSELMQAPAVKKPEGDSIPLSCAGPHS